MKHYRAKTTYFLTEGKANLHECLKLSFNHALGSGIRHIVVFTANGDGLELACRKYLSQPQFKEIKLVGVSFPYGRVQQKSLAISSERRRLFDEYEIPVVRASFPFDDLPNPGVANRSIVHRALEFFCGGMVLCLNAAVIACDQGLIFPGEHVIAMSADTSVVVKACPTSKALKLLAVREIICKPLIQDITKSESLAVEVNVDALLGPNKRRTRELPAQAVDAPNEPETKD